MDAVTAPPFRRDEEDSQALPASQHHAFTSNNLRPFWEALQLVQTYQTAVLRLVGVTLARLRLGNSLADGADLTKCTQEALKPKYPAIEALNKEIPSISTVCGNRFLDIQRHSPRRESQSSSTDKRERQPSTASQAPF